MKLINNKTHTYEEFIKILDTQDPSDSERELAIKKYLNGEDDYLIY